jgi:hypothetical protein
MLVYPPRDGVFLGERWNQEGNARLAVQREAWLGCILVIDTDTQEMEAHDSAQLVCEKPEEFLGRANRDEGLRDAE